jgi:hypothetical protein
MARPSVLSIVAATAWLAACSDGIGPPPGSGEQDRTFHHLRWSPDLGSPTFAALGGGSGFEGLESPSQSALRILDQYETSFWARRGSDTGVEIRVRAADETWQPYIRLTIPGEALDRRPDGRRFVAGDSVLITLAVDTVQLIVRLEPTGLVFQESVPARFEVWYTGADPDLDGSGTVNETDRYIETTLLAVWVQEGPDTPWSAVSSAHTLDRKLFTASLRHFSGYAVSH